MAGRIPKVVVVGPCYVDMAIKCEAFPRAGEVVDGSGFSCRPAGPGVNRAIVASLCGCESHLLSKVGDDLLGRMVIDNLYRNNVGIKFVYTAQAMSTGVIMTMVDAGGENSGCISAGANKALSTDELKSADVEQLMASSDVCLVHGDLGVDVVKSIIRIADLYKTKVVLEATLGIKQPDQIEELGWPMEYFNVDVLIPVFNNQSILTGVDAASGVGHKFKLIGSELVARGIHCVVLKMGPRGCFIVNRDGGKQIDGFEGESVANHCCCDDAFAGAFAAACGAGDSPDRAIKFASAAATIAASRLDEQERLPRKEEILQLLMDHPD